ncbi:hypothetical protein [Tamlana flava]|uniref:hypothetical protein n=1 Tax=Tamlana flava TaxID=3158572 RepID=UPI00351B64D1
MLYVEFQINTPSKFEDFKKLYHYMVNSRKLNYDRNLIVKRAESEPLEYINKGLEPYEQEVRRYLSIIPRYAHEFLTKYIQFNHDYSDLESIYVEELELYINELEPVSNLLNYLEIGFEVNMDELIKVGDSKGVVRFSTGNFPYGGLDRFLITLKAFDLIPIECFNGFTIFQFDWISMYDYETVNLPEKTKKYLSTFDVNKKTNIFTNILNYIRKNYFKVFS